MAPHWQRRSNPSATGAVTTEGDTPIESKSPRTKAANIFSLVVALLVLGSFALFVQQMLAISKPDTDEVELSGRSAPAPRELSWG